VDGENLRFVADYGRAESAVGEVVPLSRGLVIGRAITDRQMIHISDLAKEGKEFPQGLEMQRRIGHHTTLAVPLMREGNAIGAIALWRMETQPFSDKQTQLVQTFADQAAIAIDNVRLFNQTREALEQQTATAEVLQVISSSVADTRPVFDKILASCQHLFATEQLGVFLVGDDGIVTMGSWRGSAFAAIQGAFPKPLPETMTAQAINERRTLQIADVAAAGERAPHGVREVLGLIGNYSAAWAPMLWEGRGIGAIAVLRQPPAPLTEKELALLKTFADQAVIAIQNARLVNETREALDQQRASGEVLSAISSSIADATPVFEKIVQSCERLFAGKLSVINLVGQDGLVHLGAYHGPGREDMERIYPFPVDRDSATGFAILERRVLHIGDVDAEPGVPLRAREAWKAMGVRGVIAAPMLWEGKGVGAIFVMREAPGRFSEKEISLLRTFADQAVIAIQNARLVGEIQQKSRELEVANKHKSAFLASMSHELRTPLNAIIGFSEVLLAKLFGELNAKQEDYLKDIHGSGKHLLNLINDVLDLSKVEAGRMDLEPSRFDLPAALGDAMTLIRERAMKHGIQLGLDVAPELGQITADERKFKQILLNLLSNAVKFTPDGGRVDVTATHVDGAVRIAVRDTGIGIAPGDQEAVFEEFRQVGADYTSKAEGTGLGLALTRRFVELHGGRIWLTSEPGKGSTFFFTIPDAKA
jgi:signal transduction histidine kinase